MATSSAAETIVRTQDSIWELSSRGLSESPHTNQNPQFNLHSVQGLHWSPSTFSDLVDDVNQATERRVVFYVHGNWMEQDEARYRAIRLYQLLVSTVDCEPICFVAFSWPSERHEGFARDVLGKKPRLDADSYYLARAVEMLPIQKTTGFIGYSFGTAVVCGAHQLLNGGSLGHLQLAAAKNYPPARISLIAPAFDRMSLLPNGRYHLAMLGTEKLVNLYNSTDPVLKRFRFFDRDTSPTAAGFAGIPNVRVPTRLASSESSNNQTNGSLPSDLKIVQYDCRNIGRTHAELDYHTSPAIFRSLENVLGR